MVTWIARLGAQSHNVVHEVTTLKRRQAIRKSSKLFVGMDVHKESIDITVAEVAGEVRRWGEVGRDGGATPCFKHSHLARPSVYGLHHVL